MHYHSMVKLLYLFPIRSKEIFLLDPYLEITKRILNEAGDEIDSKPAVIVNSFSI
jgi:hypothetical protein